MSCRVVDFRKNLHDSISQSVETLFHLYKLWPIQVINKIQMKTDNTAVRNGKIENETCNYTVQIKINR